MLNLWFVLSPGSCGYFCLKHVLKKKIKIEKYISMYDVKKILNDNGRYCSGVKIKSVEYIKRECITLVKSGKKSYHYVVIKRVSGDYVYFYDPLFLGIKRKKIDKFTLKWSHICLFYTKV